MCSVLAINRIDQHLSLKSAYVDIMPEKDCRCLQHLNNNLAHHHIHSLHDKTILINTHITLSTLVLIDALINTGVYIMVTHADDLVCHTTALKHLQDRDLYLDFNTLKQPRYRDYFDIVLDHGGYLANILKPRISFVELTHVEKRRYSNTTCPVISINNSYLKCIETSLGAGDGFVRAIKQIYLTNQQIYTQKQYMIFGHGKVGRGIAHCLISSGVPKNNITVVEVRDEALSLARLKGYRVYNLINQYETIKNLLSTIHCVVTATGITGAISRYFTAEEFSHVEHLANMGTYDEWGEQFSIHDVLYEKKPLNFSLEIPTQIRFLDPLFTLMVKASIHMLINCHQDTFSIIDPPIAMQKEILNTWIAQGYNRYTWQDVQQIMGTFYNQEPALTSL